MPAPIWERLDNESAKAHAAFVIYRDMGPEARSLEKVRQKLGKNTVYLRQLEKWSAAYHWVDRAEAWDTQQQAAVDTLHAVQRLALVGKELTDYERLLTQWDTLVDSTAILSVTPDETGSVQALNLKDWVTLTRLRREISSIGRLALGLPETIGNTQFTGEDGGTAEIRFVWGALTDHPGFAETGQISPT